MGGGSVLLWKPRSILEVYNDIDGYAVNFFMCLRDHHEELYKKVVYTPYSRELYGKWITNWRSGHIPQEPIEQAAQWFFIMRASFSGKWCGGFAYTKKDKNQAMVYKSRCEHLAFVSNRLQGVVIENLDFEDLITRYDGDGVLIYADPPYKDKEQYYKGCF